MKRTVGKAKFVLAMAVLLSHCHSLADEQFAEQLGPVAAALRSGNLGFALTLTNLLETLAYSSSSAEDAATCRIVETYILLDAAGSEADEKAFEKATNLCASAFYSMQNHTNAWQLYGCELSMADALTADGKHAEAFAMKTNLLERISGRQLVIAETNLWTSLSCYLFESNSLSFHDAVRASAALSKAALKDEVGMVVYTNGLPSGVVGIVDSLLEKTR